MILCEQIHLTNTILLAEKQRSTMLHLAPLCLLFSCLPSFSTSSVSTSSKQQSVHVTGANPNRLF